MSSISIIFLAIASPTPGISLNFPSLASWDKSTFNFSISSATFRYARILNQFSFFFSSRLAISRNTVGNFQIRHRHSLPPISLSATVFVFLTAAAGTGIIPPDFLTLDFLCLFTDIAATAGDQQLLPSGRLSVWEVVALVIFRLKILCTRS